jgi:alpha-glucosidase
MKRRYAFLALAPLLLGCGDDDVPSQPLPDFSLEVGSDFRVDVEQGTRLIITASDGRVLLDGLAPAPIADEAPPLAGFAARDIETSYEMQFGSFKPSDDARGPWLAAEVLAQQGDDTLELRRGGRVLARLRFSAPDDGHLLVETLAGDGSEQRLSWGFGCTGDDHFAGFGAQTWDVDHRGQTVPTMVTENGIGKSETDDYGGAWFAQGRRHSSHMPIPQYLARRGYVLSAETDKRAIFALCSERDDAARIEMVVGTRVHLFDGPTPAQALERSSATHGRPRMPPRVAFAPWVDAVFGSAEVRRVAQKLRDERLPISLIWAEDWRGGEWSGEDYALIEEWEVDRSLYPDFETVADDLHALGFHIHTYFNPFIYLGSKAWDETQPNGWLVKTEGGDDYLFGGAKFTETGLLDLFHPDARAWAVEKMRASMALGADGWMNDYAEWLPTDAVTAAGSGAELHNRYPVAWQEIAREAIDGMDDGVDRMFFGRSGWFGTPELADVIWAGDQSTDFERDDGMPTIIPIGIGLGIVGVSTYGHDIAGYQSKTHEGSTKELFFRWTELGAWSPVMRTHHGNQPNKNWSWESDAETVAHFKRYTELHMALVPFLEGLAQHAHDTGMPMWRGMMLEHPADERCWSIDDQVLVGSHVLIAPVQRAGADEREVYLPSGRWYPWLGGTAHIGGQRFRVSAPLEEIPVFVRAGGIVPMYPPGVMTVVNGSASVPDPSTVGDDRIVHVFVGDDGSFHEADGLSYRLERLADDPGGDAELSFAGATLSPCATTDGAPCRAGRRAYLRGNGNLELTVAGTAVARLSIDGGATDRALEIVLRR